MKHIGTRTNRCSTTKPTLGHGVLARVDVFLTRTALLIIGSIITLLIFTYNKLSDARITVANCHTIVKHISGIEGVPDIIASFAVCIVNLLELYSLIFPIDNLEECRLQQLRTGVQTDH